MARTSATFFIGATLLACTPAKPSESAAPARVEATAAPLPAPPPPPAPSASAPETPYAAVARLVTPRMKLVSFHEDAGAVEIACEASDSEDAADLARRLAKTPGFHDVTMLSVDRPNEGGVLTFRLRARVAESHPAPSTDDEVIAASFALDSLQILGIASAPSPRVMLIDPSHRAWTARPGDLVGRMNDRASCHWRVEEVRRDSVVFSPFGATCPATPKTRTIKLAP